MSDFELEIRPNIARKRIRGKDRDVDIGLDSVLLDGKEVGHCRRRKGAPFFVTDRNLSESEIRQIKQALAEHHAKVLKKDSEEEGGQQEDDDTEAVIKNLDREVAVPPPIESEE